MEIHRTDPLAQALFKHHRERMSAVAAKPKPEPKSNVVVLPSVATRPATRELVGCGLVEPRQWVILNEVARYFKQDPISIFGRRRTKWIVTIRHIAIYLCCKMTTNSLPKVGRFFDGRDHTSIIYARDKIEREISKQSRIADDVAVLKLRIMDRVRDAA